MLAAPSPGQRNLVEAIVPPNLPAAIWVRPRPIQPNRVVATSGDTHGHWLGRCRSTASGGVGLDAWGLSHGGGPSDTPATRSLPRALGARPILPLTTRSTRPRIAG